MKTTAGRNKMRMFAHPHKNSGFRLLLKELFKSKISIFYLVIGSCLLITMISLPQYAFKQIQENENIRSEAYKEVHTLPSDAQGTKLYLNGQNMTDRMSSEVQGQGNTGDDSTNASADKETISSITQVAKTEESQNLQGEDDDTVYLGNPASTSDSTSENKDSEDKVEDDGDTTGSYSQAVDKIVQPDTSSPSMPNDGKVTETEGYKSNQNMDYNRPNGETSDTGEIKPNSSTRSTEESGGNGIETMSEKYNQNIALSPQERISKYLNFSDRTALNFMHFHKTGGVSFKTALFKFFQNKMKKSGQPVKVRDACYKREIGETEGVPNFTFWRCDWDPIRELPEEERGKYDVIFGHQYRVGGAHELLKSRDLRTFAIMRHPFDRKVSFFYHFFIRERGRNETNVAFEEVRDFLLYNKITDQSAELGQEVGPNYMAGRLLSDGKFGYVGNSYHKYFDVAPEEKFDVTNRALDIIRKYVFIGLQSENVASMCILRKTIENFNIAHGISNEGTENVATTARTLNTGSYSLNAEKIWNQFTMEDKILFDRNEKVDLAIYAEGEKLFREQAHLFGCTDSIRQDKLRK